MSIERETIVERSVPTETTVVSTGNSYGLIGGILAVIVVVLLALWLFGGAFNGGQGASVNLPTISVTP